jgi:RNA polymerase sigma factor (sigma-70 family)
VNRCQTSLRQRRGVRDISLEVQGLDLAAPGRFEIEAELRAVLLPALGRLSFDHRAVLALHYAADLPISEVARVLDIPAGTAKSRLNAALRHVRRDLRDAGDG